MSSGDRSALAPAGRLDLGPTGAGALDGVRVAVKDVFDVAGTVTGAGNPSLAAGSAATDDAAAVARLRHAGASIAAKTATDELAMGMFGANTHYGTPTNPAAPDRVPGGSSSGSASMVAAGDADLGLGSDTGGSIRVPAAFCGLFGLRPSHGRIDTTGLRPMAPSFDAVGLLAGQLGLLRRAFGVLSDIHTPRRVAALMVATDLVDGAIDPCAARTLELAGRLADALGCELRHSPLFDDDPVAAFWPLMSRQLWQTNGAWLTDETPLLGEGIEVRIRTAGEVTDAEVRAAELARAALRDRLTSLLEDAVVVLPTTWSSPPRRDTPHAQLMAWRDRNLLYVVAAPLLGAPQLSVPAGEVDDGDGPAPVGISLLGLPGDDELLLGLAERLNGTRP